MSLTNDELEKQRELAEQLLKNKLLSTTNFLNYTGLTYEDIITTINSKIASDSRFDNFRESGVAQAILEIFAGSADLVNFYIEKQAEECYFDTAKLKSSLILLSRNLAYDVKRPIPSQCRMKIIISGNFSSSIYSVGDKIQIPQYTNFSIEGDNFLLMKQFNYSLTESDLDQGDDYKKEIIYNESSTDDDLNIKLLQGERNTTIISGQLNSNVNQVFQKYLLSDKTFSNLYGEQDLVSPLTEVGIGNNIESAFPNGMSEWVIDRKTLLRTDFIETYDLLSEIQTPKKICLIRTSLDEGIELLFGDDKFVSKGLKNSSQNIYIKYLSTLGYAANKTGMIGKLPQINSSITLRNVDITNQISFELVSNITMGADIESNESIKVNAPGIFYSLDRLVSKEDYLKFLESLSNPILIKNAIAWGEQEEIKLGRQYDDQTRTAIKKLFNVVLFSVVGSLYNTGTNLSEFSIKDNLSDENAVLDSDYKKDEINSQSYFNLFTINDDSGGQVLEEIRNQTIISQGSNEIQNYLVINSGLNGDSLYEWQNFKPNTDVVTVYYTSAENISAYDAEGVNSFGFSINAANFESFDAICSWITDEVRSKNILPTDFLCTYDNINDIFTFKHSIIENGNYIVDVHDINSYTGGYNSTLKLERINGTYNYISYLDSNISYSQNIVEVINQLNKRSQITTKNVYVSPTVQRFDLNGNVYVSSLIDKDLMKTNIYNKIYSWLDEKTDFNTEIYTSNIIELIESFPTVKRADIKIDPHLLTTSDRKPFFISGLRNSLVYSTIVTNIDYSLSDELMNRSVYWKCLANGYGSENSFKIAKIFDDEVSNFINNYMEYGSTWETITSDRIKNFPKINERFFYSKLAKPIYERLKLEINNDYYSSQLFRYDISNVKKDLSYIIKSNMLDSDGNIAQEFQTVIIGNKSLKSLIRGGYSLGSEIVQIKVNLQVIYK